VQKTEICQISLDSPDHSIISVPVTGLAHAIAIDYDPIEGYIYWTDDEVCSIKLIICFHYSSNYNIIFYYS